MLETVQNLLQRLARSAAIGPVIQHDECGPHHEGGDDELRAEHPISRVGKGHKDAAAQQAEEDRNTCATRERSPLDVAIVSARIETATKRSPTSAAEAPPAMTVNSDQPSTTEVMSHLSEAELHHHTLKRNSTAFRSRSASLSTPSSRFSQREIVSRSLRRARPEPSRRAA